MTENNKKKNKIFSLDYLFYDIVKFTAWPGYLWFRPKRVFASEEARKKIKGGNLIIANHVGFSDPIIIMLIIPYRRHHFICTKDFFEGKSRIFFKGFHCIPIDKENVGMDTFRTITEHLKNDELVDMFPEGHIITEDSMSQFKSGMILMSIMSNRPIIPIYLKKREHFFSRSVVAIGEPVDVVSLYGKRPSMTQIDEAAKLLRDKELELEKLV